jgi:hypothetical protein
MGVEHDHMLVREPIVGADVASGLGESGNGEDERQGEEGEKAHV